MFFVIAWLAILAIILVVETVAIFNKRRADTLSEQIWWLRTKWWGRIILFPLWSWLSYHFFLEPSSVALHTWWDDWALVGLTLVGTAAFAAVKKPEQEERLRRLDNRQQE